MENISKFIVENWHWLIVAFFSFISLLTSFLRKKPVFNTEAALLADVYDLLPHLINEAEEKFGKGHGSEKMEYCLNHVLHYFGISNLIVFETHFIEKLKYYIEEILSTPSKKGGK